MSEGDSTNNAPGMTSAPEGLAPVPEGFEQVPRGMGFTDNLQPFYRRVSAEGVTFGLYVDKQHANMMGICHGGALMTLADIAAASGVNHARGEMGGNPTINLSLDFISAGKQGDWLEARNSEVTVRRRFGFCSGLIVSERGIVARYSGTFYLPDHDGMWQGGEGKKRIGALGASS
ncbi:PaaI family thioesterase [Parahaliea mediterranea]|uniref:PaaI family thioesterase n=1 Tax=Parahaliea mediterranea TaxID=651086 RepID=UPI001F4F0D4D|nr:PaaI family thioesterase [Parahaliea mediterranea]